MKRISIVLLVVLVLSGCSTNIKEGMKRLEAGEYEEAISLFSEDIKNKDHLEEAYRGMGLSYFELEEYENAVENFTAALDNGADETATIYSLMGACYEKTNQYEEALDCYEKANDRKDCTPELKQENSLHIVTLYERLGKWDEAKAAMKAYQSQYPDDLSVLKEAEFLETR